MRPRPTDVTSPVVLTHVDAVYPPSALAEGKHADVVLAVTVDRAGKVSAVEVVQSGGDDLDEAASDAVRQWTFTPALRGGEHVPSRIRVPFHFAPPAASEPPESEPEAPTSPPQGSVGATAPSALPEPSSVSTQSTEHAPAGTPPAEHQSVVVIGHQESPHRGAGDYSIRIGELARVPRKNAGELLTLAPGVFLSNEGGAGHPQQVFLRGFDAREGQDVEFSVAGVPINEVGNVHGNGLSDTHFIIPELVESLRLMEGPFDPHQGNFAVAGSAAYELGLARRGLTMQYTAGSFGTQRGLVLWGPPGQSVHTFGGAEVYSTDGFGQNRYGQRGSAMAGYEGQLGPTSSFRLVATSYAMRYGQAGVLRVDDLKAGRVGFYDTYDAQQGGDSSRHSLALQVQDKRENTQLSQQIYAVARDFRLRENFTGYLLDPQQPYQTAHGQRGDLLDQTTQAATLGGKGSARTRALWLGEKQELEIGYSGRFDSVEGQQMRDRASTNTPYRTDLHLKSALSNIGLFIDGNVKPVHWITLRGGIRSDFYHYDVTNLCAQTSQAKASSDAPDTECFTSDRSGYRSAEQRSSTAAMVLQPRATLLLGPFSGFTLSGSYGRGSRSLDPQYVAQNFETPFASVRAAEGGVSFSRTWESLELNARSIFFQTRVDKDLFFNETAGRSTLAEGGTVRTGWVGSARVTGDFFDLSGNLTLVRATFADTGLLIPYVPNVVLRVDGALHSPLPIHIASKPVEGAVALGTSFVAGRPLPLDERTRSLFLIDASASVRWGSYEIGILGTNLLDRMYRVGEYNYTSDFRSESYPTQVPARHFAAGEPRAIYGTFAVHFESFGGSS